MNTGVQRSSSTPFGAMTTTSPVGSVTQGQCTQKKNVTAIAAAHGIPYVATASPAFPLDLMNKVRKAISIKGPAYLQVYSPCPTGWGSKPEHSVELARLAVKTGVFPIYEITDGKLTLNHMPRKLQPVKGYVQAQKRFRHLTEETLSCIQEDIRREYARLLAAEKCSEIFENILATMER
ncbi:MAG: thiamine pyrophosphate-dependent enzyme, partial [Desulfovibrionales bacterium]